MKRHAPGRLSGGFVAGLWRVCVGSLLRKLLMVNSVLVCRVKTPAGVGSVDAMARLKADTHGTMTRKACDSTENVTGSSPAYSPSNWKPTRLELRKVKLEARKSCAVQKRCTRPVARPKASCRGRKMLTVGMTHKSSSPSRK